MLRVLASCLCSLFLLAGCAGPYAGLDDPGVSSEARLVGERARLGDKQAQYELALRFAAGDGVPRNCNRARELLGQAASNSGGTIWIYSPPVTKGGSGRVIPVDSGPVRPGLAIAKRALSGLDCE